MHRDRIGAVAEVHCESLVQAHHDHIRLSDRYFKTINTGLELCWVLFELDADQ